MTYAVVTIALPTDNQTWLVFLSTACKHAKRDKVNEFPAQNSWLIEIESGCLLFSALVVSASSMGLGYAIHLFHSEPSIISSPV